VVDSLARQARALKIGPAMDDSTQLGPVITQEHLARVMGYWTWPAATARAS
jgi:aldehyde dehydrogenase (NAD+)/betaine-aldehyde dehydrogenase